MKALVILILMLFYYDSNAQDYQVKLIVTIDEQVMINNDNFRIVCTKKNGDTDTIYGIYTPGILSIRQSDVFSLIGNDSNSIKLLFAYKSNECANNSHYINTYEIEMSKRWLQNYYNIIYVFNTTKKKYKKIFDALPGKNYTYELFFPGGQMTRVRKKFNCK